MIVVGSGALAWRAAAHAVTVGATVDAVIHPVGEPVPMRARGIEHRGTDDVNTLAAFIDEVSSDRIVCSTGNPFLFRAPILDLGLTVVNIHGGPLPGYRGLPIAAAAFAILRGEREFGATLHRVDAGIDTGAVVDRLTFPVAAGATLEELSIRVTQACHELFERNLGSLDREPEPQDASEPQDPGAGSGYFGMARLAGIGAYRDDPAFDRATDLGVLADFSPEYEAVFVAARAQRDAALGGDAEQHSQESPRAT